MSNVILISIAAVAFMIGMNLMVCKWVIYKSKRKFIIPFLEKKGWMLQEVKHVGFFNTGDFKTEIGFGFSSEMGNIINHTYAYVLAKDTDGKTIRFTVKIITVFLFIKTVEYRGNSLK